MEFRILQLSDREWVQSALDQSEFMGCEYSFANNLAWRRSADTRCVRLGEFYLCASFDTEDGVPVFYYPAGEGNVREAFSFMAEKALSMNVPLAVVGVTEEKLQLLSQLYEGEFTSEPYEDGFDYIYETKDIITLPGKRFHKKKNHLSQFERMYPQAVFSEMTEDDFDDCIAMSAAFYNEKHGYTDKSSVAEQFAIHIYFSHFHELGLKGGVLRVDGNLVGFSIGERLRNDAFVTHIEKADIAYKGAYAALTHYFTKYFAADYKYINREEDLGIEGLRRAKQSWQPAFLLRKYKCIFNHPEKLI